MIPPEPEPPEPEPETVTLRVGYHRASNNQYIYALGYKYNGVDTYWFTDGTPASGVDPYVHFADKEVPIGSVIIGTYAIDGDVPVYGNLNTRAIKSDESTSDVPSDYIQLTTDSLAGLVSGGKYALTFDIRNARS